MVRVIFLILCLTGCMSVNHEAPKFGKPTDAPYGWKYTYCPNHKNERGCK